VRGLNLHEFFNFVTQQPRLKLQQMLTFYAFAGQLKNLSAGVARRIHFWGFGGSSKPLPAPYFDKQASRSELWLHRRGVFS
jgi:hypothetical protein